MDPLVYQLIERDYSVILNHPRNLPSASYLDGTKCSKTCKLQSNYKHHQREEIRHAICTTANVFNSSYSCSFADKYLLKNWIPYSALPSQFFPATIARARLCSDNWLTGKTQTHLFLWEQCQLKRLVNKRLGKAWEKKLQGLILIPWAQSYFYF